MVHRRSVDCFFDVPVELLDAIRKKTDEENDKLKHIENLLEVWIKTDKHLPDNYDKDIARNFIRGCKFNVETAKRKLEGYFLAKHAFPHFYFDRDPCSEDITKAIDCVNIVRLPQFTDRGERIIFMSFHNPDPDQLDIIACIKLFWMLHDLTLTGEYPITAEIIIFDCTGFAAAHLVKFFSASFRHAITLLRDAYATRLSQIHVVNASNMAEKLATSFRPLLPEKIRQRFMVHKETGTLLKQVPPKLLPAEIGGNLESCRSYMEEWRKILVENADWFRLQEQVKIVGTPPKKIDKFTNEISLQGSFRQLNID